MSVSQQPGMMPWHIAPLNNSYKLPSLYCSSMNFVTRFQIMEISHTGLQFEQRATSCSCRSIRRLRCCAFRSSSYA